MRDKRKLVIETKEFTPEYGKEGSAGFDMRAYLPNHKEKPLEIKPNERILIPSGIKMDIEDGYMVLLTPRSGLALKQGITFTNSPGVIDHSYKNDVGFIIHNTSTDSFFVTHGDRIGQGLLLPIPAVAFEVVDKLCMENDRGGGFGSSGIK